MKLAQSNPEMRRIPCDIPITNWNIFGVICFYNVMFLDAKSAIILKKLIL